ncbi:MAG: response regulator [Bacillota bacterium]
MSVQERILIIEDDEPVRRSLSAQLADWGFDAVEAADGQEGVDRLSREGADLVLLDLRMPRLGGLQVLEFIHNRWPDTATIVISGAGTVEDVAQALRLGAWDYLFKPILDMEILRHAVDKALERARFLRERRAYQQYLEAEVERRTDQLRRANAAKDELLRRVSHELRTPLTPVLMELGMMKSDPALPAEYRETATMASNHLELEARLIDDLLDLASIMSRKLTLKLAPCDVHAVIRSALQVCRAELQSKHLVVQTALDASDCQVHGDCGRLQQVFCHLIRNAVKFTPRSGRVLLRSYNALSALPNDGHAAGSNAARPSADKSLVVEVSDTGMGMSPEVLASLFLPFGQTDAAATRENGGLGIGLTLCKAILELHHGTIDAHSEGPGKGSTLAVRLPAATSCSTR